MLYLGSYSFLSTLMLLIWCFLCPTVLLITHFDRVGRLYTDLSIAFISPMLEQLDDLEQKNNYTC